MLFCNTFEFWPISLLNDTIGFNLSHQAVGATRAEEAPLTEWTYLWFISQKELTRYIHYITTVTVLLIIIPFCCECYLLHLVYSKQTVRFVMLIIFSISLVILRIVISWISSFSRTHHSTHHRPEQPVTSDLIIIQISRR